MGKIVLLAVAKSGALAILMGVGYFIVMMSTRGITMTTWDLSVEALLVGLIVFVTMLFPFTFFGVENGRQRR